MEVITDSPDPKRGIDPARAMALLNTRSGGEGSGRGGSGCPCHTGGTGEYCLPVTAERGAAPSVATHDMTGMGAAELVGLMRAMQTERVESYGEFERGFSTFLEQLSAPQYEHTCAQVTAEFAHISGAINAVADALDGTGAKVLARHTRALQVLEKRKLSVTVELQLVRRELRVAELRASIHADAADEVREKREQEATLRSGLAKLVGEINEVMDEVTGELAELDELDG